MLSEFKDVLEGIGKLPGGKYHIQLKPDAQPVQHPPRAVSEKGSLQRRTGKAMQFRNH